MNLVQVMDLKPERRTPSEPFRFSGRHSPPPMLDGRVLLRLGSMVAAIVLLLVLVFNPQLTLRPLEPFFQQQPQVDESSPNPRPRAPEKVQLLQVDEAGNVERQLSLVFAAKPPDNAETTTPAAGTDTAPTYPVVDLSLLSKVQDTKDIPASGPEADAYYHLLQISKSIADGAASAPPPHEHATFADIYRHPEQYRGRYVELHGYLRGLERDTLEADNPSGVTEMFEGNLITRDSSPNFYRIVAVHVPPGTRLGKDVGPEVTYRGYFLKLWPYRAYDAYRQAPLLLGPELIIHPRPADGARWAFQYLLAGSIALTGVIIIVAFVMFRRSDRTALFDATIPVNSADLSGLADQLTEPPAAAENLDSFCDEHADAEN